MEGLLPQYLGSSGANEFAEGEFNADMDAITWYMSRMGDNTRVAINDRKAT